MEKKNNKKFLLFCVELMQAGIVMAPKEFETVYGVMERFEGFKEKDFDGLDEEHFTRQMNIMMNVMSKRKQVQENLAFTLLSKSSLDDLAKRDDLVEYVMKAKHVATKMADEFLEPDEKLEKVITEGRRLIEHFIEQWKKAPVEEQPQPKKDYEPESDAEIIEN